MRGSYREFPLSYVLFVLIQQGQGFTYVWHCCVSRREDPNPSPTPSLLLPHFASPHPLRLLHSPLCRRGSPLLIGVRSEHELSTENIPIQYNSGELCSPSLCLPLSAYTAP